MEWRPVVGAHETIPSEPKSKAVVLPVVTSSIMHQFKEIPLLESLLNFRKDVFY